jgi:hypothetical protein
MRSPTRAVIALSFALIAAPASAQDKPPPAPPPGDAPPAGSAPAQPPAPKVPTIGESSVLVSGKLGKEPAAGPAAAPIRAWKPKPKQTIRAGAVANAPSFQVLRDGASRVHVTVSAKVAVVEELAGAEEKKEEPKPKPDPKAKVKVPVKAAGKKADAPKVDAPRIFRATYRLKGATAPVKTNRLPLPTNFFETAIERISLVDDGADALLVIDFRERVKPSYKETEGERGLTLQIDVPRPTSKDEQKKN